MEYFFFFFFSILITLQIFSTHQTPSRHQIIIASLLLKKIPLFFFFCTIARFHARYSYKYFSSRCCKNFVSLFKFFSFKNLYPLDRLNNPNFTMVYRQFRRVTFDRRQQVGRVYVLKTFWNETKMEKRNQFEIKFFHLRSISIVFLVLIRLEIEILIHIYTHV